MLSTLASAALHSSLAAAATLPSAVPASQLAVSPPFIRHSSLVVRGSAAIAAPPLFHCLFALHLLQCSP
ncbi:MAG: hypothetical protein IKR48_03940 [Kiritimatiellae bacterium]|nr:hypothetical protein [Kiritimatiellia bacterium]